jgi:hypothetical protein
LAKLTLTFALHLGKDVTAKGLAVLNFSRGRKLETLGRSAVGLELGHLLFLCLHAAHI